MENQAFKGLYIIADPDGELILHTISYYKKICIAESLKGTSVTWKEARKLGWRCKKVNVTCEIINTICKTKN